MSTVVFTSLASNYFVKAKVLFQSFKAKHPDVHFAMVLVDKEECPTTLRKEIRSAADEVLGLRELLRGSVDNVEGWAFGHNLMELCTAVKGSAFLHFFARGADRVFFLDPDILVLDSLQPVFEQLRRHSILLTPHCHRPESTPERISFIECGFLKNGTYNLGFLGVKGDARGRKFAEWWNERLLHWCVIDPSRGLFTDQKWVDLAPAFFEGVHILRDPGLNVARWNMGSLPVTTPGAGRYEIGGHPIRFFHFSALDAGAHDQMLERFAGGNPVLRDLTGHYRALLRAAGGDRWAARVPTLELYSDGTRCTYQQRTLYRQRVDLQKAFPDPRRVHDDEPCYLRWYQEDRRRRLSQQAQMLDVNLLREFLAGEP